MIAGNTATPRASLGYSNTYRIRNFRSNRSRALNLNPSTSKVSFQVAVLGGIALPLKRSRCSQDSAVRHGKATRPVSAHASAAVAESGDAPEATRFSGQVKGIILGSGLCLLLCNMCRVCMSVAIIPLGAEYSWTPSTMGIIQASFLYGYMATQILGGVLADKLGGKVVMTVGVMCFALATCILPFAMSAKAVAIGAVVPLVVAFRFLTGIGQGVTMPSMNSLVARHVAPALRARAIGGIFAGFHGGTLVGLVLSPIVMSLYGWQSLFYLYGALAVPIMLLWQGAIPKHTSSVGVAAGASSPLAMLSKAGVWAPIAANFVNHWGYFTYLNWMPAYFNQVLGFKLQASTLFSFLPWLSMSVMSYVAGWIADWLVNSGMERSKVRKLVQSVAFLGPACALAPLATTQDPGVALGCFTIALAAQSFSQAGYLANMPEIAPKRTGQLFGICNTVGSLAGILATTTAGIIIEKTGSWVLVFQTMVGVYLTGVVLFNWLCTSEKLVD